MRRRLLFLLPIIIFIMALSFAIMSRNSTTGDPPRSEENMQKIAFSAAQTFVSVRLKAPATAQFPFFSRDYISKEKDIYIIRAFVDSQNSFGALIRTNYICKLRYDPTDKDKEWKLVEVRFL